MRLHPQALRVCGAAAPGAETAASYAILAGPAFNAEGRPWEIGAIPLPSLPASLLVGSTANGPRHAAPGCTLQRSLNCHIGIRAERPALSVWMPFG